MDPERLKKVQEIFERLVATDPTDLDRFLEDACGDDRELRDELRRMLRAHISGAEPPTELTDETFASDETEFSEPASGADGGAAEPGRRIGPYRIVRTLGEGGMGIVYEAEQEHPVRRRVALKSIKSGLDGERILGRFDAERQALAIMNHPNVAKVLDAGSDELGRPYFVMEYIAGLSITDYCDRRNLGTRARLDLMIQVC